VSTKLQLTKHITYHHTILWPFKKSSTTAKDFQFTETSTCW